MLRKLHMCEHFVSYCGDIEDAFALGDYKGQSAYGMHIGHNWYCYCFLRYVSWRHVSCSCLTLRQLHHVYTVMNSTMNQGTK